MNQVVEFQKFYENIKNMKFPLKTAYKLNKLITQVNNEISFYQQKFSEIINEFGKRDENGEFVYSQDGSSIEIIEGRQTECQDGMPSVRELCFFPFTCPPFRSFSRSNALMPGSGKTPMYQTLRPDGRP